MPNLPAFERKLIVPSTEIRSLAGKLCVPAGTGADEADVTVQHF
jgi:hypothetical protein